MQYGYVDGRAVNPSGNGSAPRPTVIPASGSLTFYPVTQTIADVDDVPAFVWTQPVPATFGADGFLYDEAGERGVWLLVGRHVVEITGGRRPIVGQIEVTSANTPDAPLILAAQMPLTPTPAQVFVVNEAVIAEVDAAVTDAEDARDRAEAAALAAGAVIGGPGGQRNRFPFPVARATWTINHALGYIPSDVVLYPSDSNGERVFTSYSSTDQTTTVIWPEPTSGLAVIEP